LVRVADAADKPEIGGYAEARSAEHRDGLGAGCEVLKGYGGELVVRVHPFNLLVEVVGGDQPLERPGAARETALHAVLFSHVLVERRLERCTIELVVQFRASVRGNDN